MNIKLAKQATLFLAPIAIGYIFNKLEEIKEARDESEAIKVNVEAAED